MSARNLRVRVDEHGAARRPGAGGGWVIVIVLALSALFAVLAHLAVPR